MVIVLLFHLSVLQISFSQAVEVKEDSMMLQESVMVTIEEHFGADVRTVAAALGMIKRQYQPFDQQGRTFAILDAFGNRLPDGRMHISMHISSEKAGTGKLIHRGTGKVLWNCRIYPKKDGTRVAAEKKLNIYIAREDAPDQYYTVDGSGNPSTIFDCKLNETKISLSDYWKNNTVREFIFIYSACGCPVHAKFLRNGNKSLFQSGDVVLFPDDGEVLAVLRRLMAWQ